MYISYEYYRIFYHVARCGNLTKAAALLHESDMSIAEIGRLVGYESQSKFTAAFKESYGCLPKEYRKKV